MSNLYVYPQSELNYVHICYTSHKLDVHIDKTCLHRTAYNLFLHLVHT